MLVSILKKSAKNNSWHSFFIIVSQNDTPPILPLPSITYNITQYETFQELLQVSVPQKMKLPVPLGISVEKVKFVDIAKISPILIEGNNPDERELLVQEIRWTMLYHKHSKKCTNVLY